MLAQVEDTAALRTHYVRACEVFVVGRRHHDEPSRLDKPSRLCCHGKELLVVEVLDRLDEEDDIGHVAIKGFVTVSNLPGSEKMRVPAKSFLEKLHGIRRNIGCQCIDTPVDQLLGQVTGSSSQIEGHAAERYGPSHLV